MQNQQELWNRKHSKGEHEQWSSEPRAFALRVLKDLKPNSKLLELGCGVGSDARYFAQHGINVTATDFSEVVIQQNLAKTQFSGLTFRVLDMTKKLPYKDASYDAVYAYLSLHYYNEELTKTIVEEISRVLQPNGKLYFVCKSIYDPKHADGEEIEPGVYSRNGHIRHFFSTNYTQKLLKPDFKVITLQDSTARYVGSDSAFIECWAIKNNRLA